MAEEDISLLETTNLPDVVQQTPQEVLDMIKQPGYLDLLYLGGLIETVTTVPTHVPTRYEQQWKIYVDSVTAPTVKRLYFYSNQTNTWIPLDVLPSQSGNSGKYLTTDGSTVSWGSVTQTATSQTAGESLTAGNAVVLASGNTISNIISNTTQNSNAHAYGTNWFGQTFQTSASTYSILGARFMMSLVGTMNQSCHIFLYATSGGLPTGAALADLSITPTITSTSPIGDEYEFLFSSPVVVSPSTTYALIVDFFHGDASNYIALFYNSSSVYANGTYLSSTDSGTNWTADANKDFYFKALECYQQAGRVYKAKASQEDDLETQFIGFATTSASSGSAVTVVTSGVVSGLTSLTPGLEYYLSSSSAGAISTTPTYPGSVCLALSSTTAMVGNYSRASARVYPIQSTASDNKKLSLDNVASTTSNSYTKVKEFRAIYAGGIRHKFLIQGSGSGFAATGKLYINGVAVGAGLSSSANGNWVDSGTEDITGIEPGDLIQLYLLGPGGGLTVNVSNWHIYYDHTIATAETIITN